MQCAACQHVIDLEAKGETPEYCPNCGAALAMDAMPMFDDEPVSSAAVTSVPVSVAPVSAAPVAPASVAAVAPGEPKAAKSPRKPLTGGRAMLNRVLGVFLFVGAVTIAVGSTMVAMRVIKERDQLKERLAASDKAFNDTVLAAATSSRLKGPANAQARQEIFTPAIQGYQQILQTTAQNPEKLDQAAEAAFRAAGLQARLGASACVGSLQQGIEHARLMGAANYDAQRFPSLNDTALKMTTPMDWGIMKDSDRRQHATSLLFAFEQANGVLTDLAAQYPQATVFREDLAGLQRVSAILQTAVGGRTPFALSAWLNARDQLESLLRDQPSNPELQARLVEALVGAANLQRQAGENDEAIANYKRAVEVRQQMADANPEDKSLADELAKVKSSLEKLQTPADGGNASAETSAAVQ